MVDFCMRSLNESFLLVNRHEYPLPRVSIRGDGKQSMRVILHHLKFAVFVQVLLGNVLPLQLFTYPRGERRLTLLTDANVLRLLGRPRLGRRC